MKGATTLIKYLLPQPIPDWYFPKEVAARLRRISESGYCFFILLAKRPYPSFVGKGLFASSGATTFLNVRQNICATFQDRTFCLRPFCKRGCSIFAWDNYYPGITTVKLLFFSHSDQRKEAKERRLISETLLHYYDYGSFSLKYFCAIATTPILKYFLS